MHSKYFFLIGGGKLTEKMCPSISRDLGRSLELQRCWIGDQLAVETVTKSKIVSM